MTTALFVHDFPIKYNKSNGNYYSTGFSYEIWKRYLNVFDSLNVVSRINQESVTNEALSSGPNVKFHPMKSYKNLKSLLLRYPNIKKELRAEVIKADCVIIRLPSVLGFLAADLCLKEKKKYLVEVVGSMFDAYWHHSGILNKVLAYPSENIQRKLIKNADVAVYITYDYLQSIYPNMNISFDGVSNVTIPDDSTFKPRKRIIESSDPIKIGLVGSTFVNYKGHNRAVDCINSLRKQGYNVELEFVGQGLNPDLKDYIKKSGVSDKVHYIGMINNREEMNNWYKSLDIYIQPSKTEGHGRAVVEAINNNVPVFASNVGGLPDSINQEYMFDLRDKKGLEKLIKKAITNPEWLNKNIKDNFANIQKYKKSIITEKRNQALITLKNLI